MPDVSELGRLVKKKYPEYNNIPDAELGRLVKKKYPAYSNFTDEPSPAQSADLGQMAMGAAKGVVVNPIAGAANLAGEFGKRVLRVGDEALKGNIGGAADALLEANPLYMAYEVGKGALKGHADEFRQAGEALRQGDYMSAAGHALYGAMPLVGPAMSQSMAVANDPNKSSFEKGEALGDVAANLIPGVSGLKNAKVQIAKVGKRANQADLEFMKRRNIPMAMSDATDNAFLGMTQQVSGAGSLVGGIVAGNAKDAKRAALKRTMAELADETGAPVTDPYAAGKRLGQTLERKARTFADEATTAYGELAEVERLPKVQRSVPVGIDAKGQPVMKQMAIPVDVKAIKDWARPVLEELNQRWAAADPDTAKVLNQQRTSLKSIIDGPDFKPASIAEKDLGALKALVRNSATSTESTLRGADAMMQLQKSIDDSVASIGGPQALRALQKGRANWATKADIEETLMQLRDEPVQAFKQTQYAGDAGIDYLKRLQQHAPEQMAELGRAYLEDLFTKATADGGVGHTALLKSSWDKLGPKTKEVLFPNPAHRKDLDSLFRVTDKQGRLLNTSRTSEGEAARAQVARFGTAAGGALLGDATGLSAVTGAIVAEIGGAALAKAMYSPKFVAKLTEGYKLPAGSAAQKLVIANLIEMARERGGQE